MIENRLAKQKVSQLLTDFPYLQDFFSAMAISVQGYQGQLGELLNTLPKQQLLEFNISSVQELITQCQEFIEQMQLLQNQGQQPIKQVTVLAGIDKSAKKEKQDLHLKAGEVVCVVGPTGSGKSQLLADIESLAQRDTPSQRQVLLDGVVPDEAIRMSGEQQLVAQLSQNMNFVMDLSVSEFISMHAESRMVNNVEESVQQVFQLAVDLAGEAFSLETPVTALSGGQSRSLMIADVACLSSSPIVLIDEIENAGVDRLRALELLVSQDKMVLMATHDPLLALSGDRRLVIKNGGIDEVICTSEEEKAGLKQLAALDKKLAKLRDQVRKGERISFDLN